MSKQKTTLLIGGIILAVGLVIGLIGLALSHFSFKGLSSDQSVTNTYDVSESFDQISIDVDTDDIEFLPAADGKCRVVCQESEKIYHKVFVSGKTLTIQLVNNRSWTDFFGFESYKITVYLPGKTYAALVIEASTGDITLPADFSFDTLRISASTGDINCAASAEKTEIALDTGDISLSGISSDEITLSTTTGHISVSSVTCSGVLSTKVDTGKTVLKDVSCESFVSTGTTGRLSMTNVIVKESIAIERSTGDITFDGCDADTIKVKTSTGDVSGTLLTEKIFFTETSTGDIHVPKSMTGGACEITTDTGDIEISIR